MNLTQLIYFFRYQTSCKNFIVRALQGLAAIIYFYVNKRTFQCLYITTHSESLAPSPYMQDINIVNKNEPVSTKLSDCTTKWHGINNSSYHSFVHS